MKGLKALHLTGQPFDEAVILLDNVIQLSLLLK